MAHEIKLIAPTGGERVLPWREGLTLDEAVRFAGFTSLSGQWYRTTPNNGSVTARGDEIVEDGATYILTPATKAG